MKLFLKILLISLMVNLCHGQKTVLKQQIYWLRYYNQFSLNKKLVLHQELENRRFLPENTQHHFISHSHLHYKFSPRTEFALGLTYSRQSPQTSDAAVRLVVPEIRPFQEISWADSVTKKLTLQHRIRVDNRFIRKSSTTELLDGYDFNWRFRYRLMLAKKLSSSKAKQPLVGRFGTEVMFNAGKRIVFNHFDQFRVIGTLEQRINKSFSVEGTYIHWYQQRASGNQFFSRNIGRLTLIHRI